MGLAGFGVAVEGLGAHRDALSEASLVVEYADTCRGRGDLRPLVRHQIEAWGARLVGTGAADAQVCDDKIAARERLERAGLTVAPARVFTAADLGREDGWTFPAVVKRPFEHGSRGVRRVEDRAGLDAVASRWIPKDGALLVERFVAGRELALSVVEVADGPRCLPPVEVALAPDEIYTRQRKWKRDGPPLGAAGLTPAEVDPLRVAALAAFRALGLRDLARFDVRLAANGPIFLEANVRPSVEPGLELPLAASLAGLPFVELARAVLLAAARRHGQGDILRRLGA
jgi:D-alanine-D-alanine ligase